MQEFKTVIAKLPEPVIKCFHGLEPSVWTVEGNWLKIATTACTPVMFNLERLDFDFSMLDVVHVPTRSGVIVTLKGDELQEECLEPHLGALRESIEEGDPTAIADGLMFYLQLQLGKSSSIQNFVVRLDTQLKKLPEDIRTVIDTVEVVKSRVSILRSVLYLNGMFNVQPGGYVTKLLDYAVTCLYPELMADPAKLMGKRCGKVIKGRVEILAFTEGTYSNFIPNIADVTDDTLDNIRLYIVNDLAVRCGKPEHTFEYRVNSDTYVPMGPLIDFLKGECEQKAPQ